MPPVTFALPPPRLVTDGAGAAVPVRRVAVADGTRLVLEGSEAADDVTGGSGADTLNGGGGNHFLSSRDGNDVPSGGAGLDVLMGGKGADSLSGGGDVDQLYGGAGADTLEGGTGADVFRFRRGDAGARPDLGLSDWVADLARAEGDVSELTGFTVGATVPHRGEGYCEVLERDAAVATFRVTRPGTDAAGKPAAIAITDLAPGDFALVGGVAPPAPTPAPAPRPVARADLPAGVEEVAVLVPAEDLLPAFADAASGAGRDAVAGDSWLPATARCGEDPGWAFL